MSRFQRKTPKGHEFGEASSAMQKAIRRGDEERALYFASQLDLAGYGEYVWKRLKIICSEDVGLAEPTLPAQIRALYENWRDIVRRNDTARPAHRIILMHAVLLLVRAKKSRICDHAGMVFYRDHDSPPMDIPDYALDKHTARGRRMGRGLAHFFHESSRIENEPDDLPDPYAERAWEIMKHEPPQWPPGHPNYVEPRRRRRQPASSDDVEQTLLEFESPDEDDEPDVGPPVNWAEERARATKVTKLVNACRSMRLGAEEAASLDPNAIQTLARAAGCRPPSETTWNRVLETLRDGSS